MTTEPLRGRGADAVPGWLSVIRMTAARSVGGAVIAILTVAFVIGMGEVGLVLMRVH